MPFRSLNRKMLLEIRGEHGSDWQKKNLRKSSWPSPYWLGLVKFMDQIGLENEKLNEVNSGYEFVANEN